MQFNLEKRKRNVINVIKKEILHKLHVSREKEKESPRQTWLPFDLERPGGDVLKFPSK